MFTDAATEDFFRARLDHMIDLRQSLAVLASRMPWQQVEAYVAHLFSRKAHTLGRPCPIWICLVKRQHRLLAVRTPGARVYPCAP